MDLLNFYTFFAGIFLVAGIPLTVYGIKVFLSFAAIRKNCTAKTFGKVTQIKQNDRGLKTLVVEYRTNRKECRGEYGLPSKVVDYIDGQQAVVIYDSEKDDRFYLPDDVSYQNVYKLFISIGGGAVCSGIICILMNFMQLGL